MLMRRRKRPALSHSTNKYIGRDLTEHSAAGYKAARGARTWPDGQPGFLPGPTLYMCMYMGMYMSIPYDEE